MSVRICPTLRTTRVFATSTRNPPKPPPRSDAWKQFTDRAPALGELAAETATILRNSGLSGVRRSVQAAVATGGLLREVLSTGAPDPPQVLLRKLFERLGATYIKLGQFIASSPTLFPDAYVVEFQKCLDATEPVPFDFIQRRIGEELELPIGAVFASIDPVPIASASVAQVHGAVLKSSQKRVVVKVLKPGVEDVLTTDLNFLYLASRLLEILNPELSRISLAAIVGDIRKTIVEEVDFEKEAQHIQHFQNYLQSTGRALVAKAPYVYSQYSTKK